MSGSVIVVTTVALGACICLGASARRSRTISIVPSVAKQSAVLLATVCVTLLIPLMGGFSVTAGVLGVLGYGAFLAMSLQGKAAPMLAEDSLPGPAVAEGESAQDDDESARMVKVADGDDDDHEHGDTPTAKGVIYLLAGGLLIFLYADDFIDAVVTGASSLHLSPTLLAFFLAPVASEAPEILESIQLSKNGNNQNINVAFSNLVGGTISKTTLLFAIFNFYGVARGFAYEPGYTVSIVLLSLCAGAAGATGAIRSEKVPFSRGVAFFVLFAFTGFIQYFSTTTNELVN